MLVIGHLNISSLRNNVDQLKLLFQRNSDTLLPTETKIDSNFPTFQFEIEGYSTSYRFDIRELEW